MSAANESSWRALGTTVGVVVTRASALARARDAVVAELAEVDRSCSRFRADSELARVNDHAGRPVEVDAVLIEALTVALRAAVLTGGRVDPTIGRALVAAGYDTDFAVARRRPDPTLKMTAVPGWRCVVLDPGRRRVMVPRGVQLDLGATAKAWAADRAVAAAVAATSGTGVLVNLGGDIAVGGPPPEAGWAVRVTDDHAAPGQAPGQTVVLRSGGLATSSTTVRRWGTGHHIIDPATGLPAAERWRTVSVAAGCCVDANIASTAAIVGGDSAVPWLREHRMPARLVDPDSRVTTVAGWPRESART